MKDIASYGGGTQSTAMILMALNGEYGLPRPDFAVWADTGAEPKFIVDYVQYFTDYCKKEFDFDIFTVRHPKNNLTEGLKLWIGKDYTIRFKTLLPFYTKNKETGERGVLMRKCTTDYKIVPQIQFIKKKIGDEKYRKWYGISFDERSRMKISQDNQCENYYPLVENFVNRQNSIDYVKSLGLRSPQRSSCIYCPFHSNKYWEWLKTYHPNEFERAVIIDENCREMAKLDKHLEGELFLHNSLQPLSSVEFTDKNQLNMFPELIDECAGECGI